MADFRFYVTVEDGTTGEQLGFGPLESVTSWEYTARFDRAGAFSVAFDASDPTASFVTNLRVLRCMALLDDAWVEVGAGIVDKKGITVQRDGRVTYGASGLDLMRELSLRNVGQMGIGLPSGTALSVALGQLEALQNFLPLAVPEWTFTPTATPANDYVYARFDGESVLGACIAVAEKTQTHFYRSTDRELIFTSDFEDSGITAMEVNGMIAPGQAAITSLTQICDTYDFLTRIYPVGSGQGKPRLYIRAATRTAPTGYTHNLEAGYIENDEAVDTYGIRDFPIVEFKEITPISNSRTNVIGAMNMLYDQALSELRRRSSRQNQRAYTLSVAGCQQLLRPMQTIRVIYHHPELGIEIDETLKILEATWRVDPSGISTTRLTVSTDDKWPDNDESAAAERAAQGRVFAAHPQLGPNSYWENFWGYIGNDSTTDIAKFPFVLGPEVTQVDRVRLRCTLDPVLSFTSVAAGKVDVELSMEIDELEVSLTGSIDLPPHSHPLPSHQHKHVVAHTSSVDRALSGTDVSGNMVMNYTGSDVGDLDFNTDAVVGTFTDTDDSSSGIPIDLSGSGGTGSGTTTGTIDLSDAIVVGYGVYKETEARTYEMDEVQYRINGGSWIDLDTGTDVSDGWVEFDLTDDVMDADTFTPTMENNLIEFRHSNTASTIPLDSSAGFTTRTGIGTSPEFHGVQVGDVVTIAGTVHHNGTFNVVGIQNEYVFYVDQTGDTNFEGAVGTVTIKKSATVFAKLGVVTFIQGVQIS